TGLDAFEEVVVVSCPPVVDDQLLAPWSHAGQCRPPCRPPGTRLTIRAAVLYRGGGKVARLGRVLAACEFVLVAAVAAGGASPAWADDPSPPTTTVPAVTEPAPDPAPPKPKLTPKPQPKPRPRPVSPAPRPSSSP